MGNFDHDVIIGYPGAQFEFFDFDLRFAVFLFLFLFRVAELPVIHDFAYRGLRLGGDLY